MKSSKPPRKPTGGKADAKKSKLAAKPKETITPLTPLTFHLGKVLVPVDFSEHSNKALRYAMAFAKQFNAELVVIHIVEQIVYPGDWMYPPIAVAEWAGDKREQVLTRLRELTKKAGLKAEHMVRIGRAWQEIVEIAKETECDLVVIATHGHGGLRHALLGSVTEKIIRHAPCPVLTVRADERDFV